VQDAEDQMLGADEAVAKVQGLAERELEGLLGRRSERRAGASFLAAAGRPGHVERANAELGFDRGADGVEVDADGLEGPSVGLTHWTAAYDVDGRGAKVLDGEAGVTEHVARHAGAACEGEDQVLGADEVVAEEPGFVLGVRQDVAGFVGEAFEHP
jgi:hypothetical protein